LTLSSESVKVIDLIKKKNIRFILVIDEFCKECKTGSGLDPVIKIYYIRHKINVIIMPYPEFFLH
jgi:hypothetical protein